MAPQENISKVAIVGAAGNCGRFMTEALLHSGKDVTAITRQASQNTFPSTVHIKRVDYDKQETLVQALQGQDALIITLSGHAKIDEIEVKLVEAANSAGVPWILRNEWGPDTENEDLVRDVFIFQKKTETRRNFQSLTKSSFIAVCTGFWYEWSLPNPAAFGFDIAGRKVTLFDEGDAKTSISTWPHVGRTVAALLNLPCSKENANGPSLQDFRNQVVYTSSFVLSQNDMLDSLLRVTSTKRSDWTIAKEPSKDRYSNGLAQTKQGNWAGLAAVMYTRVFFPDEPGNFESKESLDKLLDLPKDDLDAATKRGIDRVGKSTWS